MQQYDLYALIRVIFNKHNMYIQNILEKHQMWHPMSWCPDLVTLEVKTHDAGVMMSLSPTVVVAATRFGVEVATST